MKKTSMETISKFFSTSDKQKNLKQPEEKDTQMLLDLQWGYVPINPVQNIVNQK